MQKRFVATGVLALMLLGASAQNQKLVLPKPPAPPPPPAVRIKETPPPAPEAPPAPATPETPPPPPAPPEPPLLVDEAYAPIPDDYAAFLQRNPSVKSLAWYNNEEVVVQLKSGGAERYKLNAQGRKAIEAKYGELPAAPPPPPPPAAPPSPKKKRTLS